MPGISWIVLCDVKALHSLNSIVSGRSELRHQHALQQLKRNGGVVIDVDGWFAIESSVDCVNFIHTSETLLSMNDDKLDCEKLGSTAEDGLFFH